METPLRIRNVLFRAFFINLLVIVAVWLISLSGVVTAMLAEFFGFGVEQSHIYMANLIGFWKILNVVLFLIPTIAIHWEYRPKK